MNVEKIGTLMISIILICLLSIKYVKRYYPLNVIIIPIITFIDAIYAYLTIYNVFTHWYINLIIYFFNIIIPLILVLLQYNNIILKRQIVYYIMSYLFKAKEYDKTILYITKLVKIEGRTNKYMYILGKCYKAKGDFINARDSFALAIQLDPKDFKSCYELGMILDETNKKDSACAMFNKALKLNSNFYEAAEALGISFTSQGKFKKAIKVYLNIVKKFPKAYEIYYNIGMLEMETGNYKEAIEAFNNCANIKPNLFMAHYNIGKLQFMLKDYDSAIDSYKKIVSSPIYGAKAYFKIAMIFAIKKDYEKAMVNLEYSIALDENFLNEVYKESCFRNMKEEINNFCIAREKLININKQKSNFITDRFKFLRKKDDLHVKISI